MITRKISLGLLMAFTLGTTLSANAAAKRYLVQFKSPATYFATTQSLSAFNNPLSGNGSFVTNSEMKLMGMNAAVTQNLDHLQMLVIKTDDLTAVESLKSHPAIALVEEEIFFPAPAPISTHSATIADVGEPSPTTAIPMPWGIAAVRAPEAWTVTRGAGARVMVLDTGLDTQHPAIASRFEQGQNFTDGDPSDITDQVGHGTHVTGTISADGANGGLVGVAPEVKILMGKVCTTAGCSSIGIAGGLNWAVEQKVDVVSMSLGGPFMSNSEALAVQAAEAAGVMIVAASGNDGKMQISYPGASATVLAVGAIDSTNAKAEFSNWGPQLGIMGPGVNVYSSVPRGTGRQASVEITMGAKGLSAVNSVPLTGSPAVPPATAAVVFVNLGQTSDFANVDVKGKFVLISRGIIPFKDKVTNAAAAGAIGAIIFDNAPGLASGTISTDGTEAAIPAVMIEQASGQAVQAELAAGQVLTASMGILKTDYATYQGTSMATPHVSGVAALVRAANHSLTPAQVRDIMKQTATPLTPNDQNQMGSGLVNAEAAVKRATAAPSFFRVAN